MAERRLSPDELLTTTRSTRRHLDLTRPVDAAVLRDCVAIALQAGHVGTMEMGVGDPPPSPPGIRSRAHFVVVTDPARRAALAALYRRALALGAPGRERVLAGLRAEGGPRAAAAIEVVAATDQLAERLDRVPVHVVPCIAWRASERLPVVSQASLWGSIFPAVWSFLLAARARGLGGIVTTAHLQYEREAAEVLGIPHEAVTQAALIPLAHVAEGTFEPGPPPRLDAALHLDGW